MVGATLVREEKNPQRKRKKLYIPVAELKSRVALEMWKELSTVCEYFLPGSMIKPRNAK